MRKANKRRIHWKSNKWVLKQKKKNKFQKTWDWPKIMIKRFIIQVQSYPFLLPQKLKILVKTQRNKKTSKVMKKLKVKMLWNKVLRRIVLNRLFHKAKRKFLIKEMKAQMVYWMGRIKELIKTFKTNKRIRKVRRRRFYRIQWKKTNF